MTELVRCKGRYGPRGFVIPCVTCDLRSYAPTAKGTKWLEPAAEMVNGCWQCPNRRVDLDAIPLED